MNEESLSYFSFFFFYSSQVAGLVLFDQIGSEMQLETAFQSVALF